MGPGKPLNNRELVQVIKIANECLRAQEGRNLLYYMDDYPDEREVMERALYIPKGYDPGVG